MGRMGGMGGMSRMGVVAGAMLLLSIVAWAGQSSRAEMQRVPLYVDQTGGLSIAQLAARARRLKRQKGLDLLVIDYIQLLQGTSRRGAENATRVIAIGFDQSVS